MLAVLDALTACENSGDRPLGSDPFGFRISYGAGRKAFELAALYIQSYHFQLPETLKTWFEYYRYA